MGNYTRNRVVSVRIDSELLEAVRERARETGRSVSGEIVYLVREQVEARPASPKKPRPITGWLSTLAVPETHAEFRKARREASAKLSKSVAVKAKRK